MIFNWSLSFRHFVSSHHQRGEERILTLDNATDVSLSCEMSLFLCPDEDLQWSVPSQTQNYHESIHSGECWYMYIYETRLRSSPNQPLMYYGLCKIF